MGDDPKSRFAWAASFRPTRAERRVIAAAAAGEAAEFSEPATIRAALIRILMLGARADWPVASAGVQILGPAFEAGEAPSLIIDGLIDLAFARAADGGALPPLRLRRCRLGDLRLTGCAIAELDFTLSHAGSVAGSNLLCARHFGLEGAGLGAADFSGAALGGEFSANGAKFRNAGGNALRLDRAEIGGGVFLRGAECDGETNCSCLTTRSQFSATGANFRNAGGNALRLDGADIGDGVFLRGAEFDGEAVCAGLRTRSQFAAKGAKFRNAGGDALRLGGAEIGGGVFIQGAECDGEADCAGLRTRGQFAANDAKFHNKGGNALRLDGAEIGGDVFLDEAECDGETDCSGLTTRGQFSAVGAKFRNEGGNALRLDSAAIDSGVFLRNAQFAGRINAQRIEAVSFLCSGASFDGGGGMALDLESAVIAQSAYFGTGAVSGEAIGSATIKGLLNLAHARIGGRLQLTGAHFAAADKKKRSLVLRRAKIDGELETLGFYAAPAGLFDLTGAEIASIHDDPARGWPAAGRLMLDNLTYGAIRSDAEDDADEANLAKSRISWLRRQYQPGADGEGAPPRGEFSPQPFEQMEKALRAAGHDYAATRIAVERREWRRKCIDRGFDQALNGVLKITSDYGYSPGRAFACYAAWVVFGAAIVWAGLKAGAFEFAGEDAGKHGDRHLEPIAYAIDLTIPIIDFGQASAFRPAPSCLTLDGVEWLCQGRDLGEVFYSLIGFTLFSILVLTLTGVLRGEKE